jgi:hypothetical protein
MVEGCPSYAEFGVTGIPVGQDVWTHLSPSCRAARGLAIEPEALSIRQH